MFAKIYQIFDAENTSNIQDFPIDLIKKIEICINNPEKYAQFFLNITDIIVQKFKLIAEKQDDRLATSFMRGIAESRRCIIETFQEHFKVGSCGIYDEDLYVVKEIIIDNTMFASSNNVVISILQWGKDENEFDVVEKTISFSKFMFSNDDMKLNLLLIPNVPIE